MAVTWLRRLAAALSLTRRPVHALCVVGKAARETVFMPVLRLVPISLIPLILCTHVTFTYYRSYVSLSTESTV